MAVTGMDGEESTEAGSLDPRRLLIFREVARCGSLSGAAAALGWTQPAVSQHIHRLERDLGLPLVLRSSRGITLSDAGTRLLGHADAVASRLSAASEEMQDLVTLRRGRMRLVAFPSALATLVPNALVQLSSSAPALEIRLAEHEPAEATAMVLAGDADLAITFSYPDAEDIEHRDLLNNVVLEDQILAVLPAGHRLATGRDTIDLAELADERWVAGCPRCRSHLLVSTGEAGFEPDIRHSTDDYVVVQNLVSADLVVALLPRLALSAARNDGVVVVPLQQRADRRVSLTFRPEAAASPAVRATVDALTRSCKLFAEDHAV